VHLSGWCTCPGCRVIPISDIVNQCGLGYSFSHQTSLGNEVIPGITLCLFYVLSQGEITVLFDYILKSRVCRGWNSSHCFNNNARPLRFLRGVFFLTKGILYRCPPLVLRSRKRCNTSYAMRCKRYHYKWK
jgi:hypothetical protein